MEEEALYAHAHVRVCVHVEADEALLVTAQRQNALTKGRRKTPIKIYRHVPVCKLIGQLRLRTA